VIVKHSFLYTTAQKYPQGGKNTVWLGSSAFNRYKCLSVVVLWLEINYSSTNLVSLSITWISEWSYRLQLSWRLASLGWTRLKAMLLQN